MELEPGSWWIYEGQAYNLLTVSEEKAHLVSIYGDEEQVEHDRLLSLNEWIVLNT
jgi:hypothetical protein